MTTTALSLVVLAALGPVEPVASQDAPAPRIEALPVDQLRHIADSPATASRWRITVRPRTLGISLSFGF